MFTAVAVMQLVEKKKIRLEAPVQTYLPAFPFPTVRVKHLLSHTSGLPDFELFDSVLDANPSRTMYNEDILPALNRGVKLLFEPGSQWRYSSTGIGLLAMIVAKQSKMDFASYLDKYIFRPAGMKHTYINYFDASVQDAGRLPSLMYPVYYANDLALADTVLANQRFLHASGGVAGPGLVVSDAADLLAFDRALDEGKLLRAATIKQMFTPVLLNDGHSATARHYPGTVNFCLGWFILQDSAMGRLAFHSGYKPGTASILLKRLDKRETVILLDNGNSSGINTSAFNCIRLLDGLPAETLKTAVTFPFGRTLVSHGMDRALIELVQHRADTVHYTTSPTDWLAMGYELFRTGKLAQSLETFHTGYLIYPQHAFLCQVYGDVLLAMGKKEEAVMLYQKSLQLRSDNAELKKKLKGL